MIVTIFRKKQVSFSYEELKDILFDEENPRE